MKARKGPILSYVYNYMNLLNKLTALSILVIISHAKMKIHRRGDVKLQQSNGSNEPDSVQIHTGIWVYRTVAQSLLTYGSEAWTVRFYLF